MVSGSLQQACQEAVPRAFFQHRLGLQGDTLVAVDDAGSPIPVLPWDVAAVGQMDMTMQHQLGMVAVQQLVKDGEAAVGQVVQVAVAVHRRVGDKDVKPAVAVDLAPQAVDALAHLGLGKLPGAGAVAAGPTMRSPW